MKLKLRLCFGIEVNRLKNKDTVLQFNIMVVQLSWVVARLVADQRPFLHDGWRNSMRLNRGTSVFCNSESKTNFTLWTQQGGARINTLIQWFTVTCLGCYVLVVATEWEPGKTKSVIREWVWRQPFTACETRNVAEEDTTFSSMRSKQIILSLFWEMTNNDNKKYYIQFSQLLYV